ncbi:hypothetical protein SAY87_022167 [Trapa incisa]|uniref:Pentatricopeptide repeat-containing protein n=1 Tax=Trapa incisa TaxID=236973 RepID=A0AAN7JSU5_9MYRT|nr:hypothetical protein SAY87_022167 [Trapa incisa]
MKMAIGSVYGNLRRLPSSPYSFTFRTYPLSSFAGALALSYPDQSTSWPSCPSSSPFPSNGSFCSRSPPVIQPSYIKLLHPQSKTFRLYSAGESRSWRLDRHHRKLEKIMELVRGSSGGIREKLDELNVRLPVTTLVRILFSMNAEKIPALEFIDWVRTSIPEHACNPDICSLAVDNCGRLDDYGTMVAMLEEFSLKGVCLNRKAFGFLNVLASSKTSVKSSVRNMVEILKGVRGSCLVSGICALIEMFSSLGSVDIAKYIIAITEHRVSHYNILVREMCRRCDLQGVKRLLIEMRQSGCFPNESIYNYFISSLCRNNLIEEAREMLEEMQRSECPPNALTYEVLICYYLRKTREVDVAVELLDQMVTMGIEPRLSTAAAFIKAYFNSGQHEEAYKFVISSWLQSPINVRYTLLASLYQKEGDIAEAHKILVEMMEKGLRPNSSVYKRVLRHLLESKETDMVLRLTQLITQFNSDAG